MLTYTDICNSCTSSRVCPLFRSLRLQQKGAEPFTSENVLSSSMQLVVPPVPRLPCSMHPGQAAESPHARTASVFGPQSVHAATGSQAGVSTDALPRMSLSDDAFPSASAQSRHPRSSISLADDPELAADIVAAAAAAAEASRAAKHAADLPPPLRQ